MEIRGCDLRNRAGVVLRAHCCFNRAGRVKFESLDAAVEPLRHWPGKLVAKSPTQCQFAGNSPIVLDVSRENPDLLGIIGGDREAAAGGKSVKKSRHSLTNRRGGRSIERTARPVR